MNPISIQNRLTVQKLKHGAGFEAHGIRGVDSAMDPFLMADHYRMSQPTFGPHPHAGFSAVTYMFDDAQTGFRNRDSLGDSSEIRAGDSHWSVAGRGLVHDEVPVENGKIAHGLQMFINLAAKDKHNTPYSIHIKRENMPQITQSGGAIVKVIFGAYDFRGEQARVAKALPTEVSLFDVSLSNAGTFEYDISIGDNAFLHVVRGEVAIGGETLFTHQAAGLGSSGGSLKVSADQAAQFVLFLGRPLNEPVVRQGPFAMTNQADIERAIADFQSGRMGSIEAPLKASS